MQKKLRKHPSIWNKPKKGWKVLEVGAGQLPFENVTHIVDKFPDSNEQRGEDLWVPDGITFFEGELERLPFNNEKFDYLYARHIFEHVLDPEGAISEVNRVASRGYIETPSPTYEMLRCDFPYNVSEMHTIFVWAQQSNNTLYVVRKNSKTLSDFCDCENGRMAKFFTETHRQNPDEFPESFLPKEARTTRLYFNGKINLKIFDDFQTPCDLGCCAFGHVQQAVFRAKWPWVLTRRKSKNLRSLLLKNKLL